MEGKVIAITGGGSGIGLSLALLLAKKGAKLSLADISRPGLDTAAQAMKDISTSADHVMTYQVDVRHDSQVKAWMKVTVEWFGRVDGAANIAGVYWPGNLEDMEFDEWDRVMGINVTGVMLSLKAELRHMSNGGSIVNAASLASFRGFAGNSAYSTSKHAVVGLTKSREGSRAERYQD